MALKELWNVRQNRRLRRNTVSISSPEDQSCSVRSQRAELGHWGAVAERHSIGM